MADNDRFYINQENNEYFINGKYINVLVYYLTDMILIVSLNEDYNHQKLLSALNINQSTFIKDQHDLHLFKNRF